MSIQIPESDDVTTDESFEEVSKLLADPHEWHERIRTQFKGKNRSTPEAIFGPAGKGGSVYRWGVAAAVQGPCPHEIDALARMACDWHSRHKSVRQLDVPGAAEALISNLASATRPPTARQAALAVSWAAALPAASHQLETNDTLKLVQEFVQWRERMLDGVNSYSPLRLVLGAELAFSLAWRLPQTELAKVLVRSGSQSLRQWCRGGDDSISEALTSIRDVRLVMASLIRALSLAERLERRKTRKTCAQVGTELATWVAALTSPGGRTAFSEAHPKHLRDDTQSGGLLDQAARFDPESLVPAMAAAQGKKRVGGRLTWQVSLPEALHHDHVAKVAVCLPDWDVRRGRSHIRYRDESVELELFSGKNKVISGSWDTTILLDGEPQRPVSDWSEICEFSDDDVHYLEIEQVWTKGMAVQRQILVLREDRCVLLADSLLPQSSGEGCLGEVAYATRLHLAEGMRAVGEPETRELFLHKLGTSKKSTPNPKAMVIPLSACEWRVGPSAAQLDCTDDQVIVLTAKGHDRLFVPLWFDFQPRRFKRKRTWRQLTVADQLRIVGPDEAVAYRIQQGSEQWAVYRSLMGHVPRTFLGKHLIADFVCSRFDPSDGSHEELVTVDDRENTDDGDGDDA